MVFVNSTGPYYYTIIIVTSIAIVMMTSTNGIMTSVIRILVKQMGGKSN